MRISTAHNMREWRRGERGERVHKAEGGGQFSIQHSAFSVFSRPPSAFTLIEMLVVVTIMMILVAVSATAFRPANNSRRIREAARAINVYLSSARNRAMETGRPCGVILRRFNGTSTVMNLDQCEVPPSYCGDTTGAAMQFTSVSPPASGFVTVQATPTPPGSFNSSIVSGGLIQFNCQGPSYQITPATTDTQLTATLDVSLGQAVPWVAFFPTVPYVIYRSPVKGAATPLQLPAATVVDIGASSIDDSKNNFFSNATSGSDTTILFNPNGSIDRVFIPGVTNSPFYATQSIFLLVGSQERVNNPFVQNNSNEPTFTNYQDANNLWVVINSQTGLVTTGPVAAPSASDSTMAAAINTARALARDSQGMGGK